MVDRHQQEVVFVGSGQGQPNGVSRFEEIGNREEVEDQLGDLAGAKEAWEDLVSIHPFSEPAYKAQGLLDQLP